MFKLKKTRHMKKQYIIPVSEVVEIKTNQLLMTSTMSVDSSNELENSGEILSREYNGFDE